MTKRLLFRCAAIRGPVDEVEKVLIPQSIESPAQTEPSGSSQYKTDLTPPIKSQSVAIFYTGKQELMGQIIAQE